MADARRAALFNASRRRTPRSTGCSQPDGPLAAITAELGLSRTSVRWFARAADPAELLVRDWRARTAGILHDYEPYPRER
jgi:hypothetical protein